MGEEDIKNMIDTSGIKHCITNKSKGSADDAIRNLNNIRMKYVKNVNTGHLNVNSLLNKCDALCIIN